MHVSRICSDLVRIKSENPPGKTDDAIEYIRVFLEGIGITSQVYGNGDGLDNLVAVKAGAPLLFAGHVDVVPASGQGWDRPPFSGEIAEGFVWGRGATDMKGGCAAILAACQRAADAGQEIPASLAFVCDEEEGGVHGMQYLLAKSLLAPCDCVIAEPTPARHPTIGQKGLCRTRFDFHGVPAHGSLYPAVGVSAIDEAMALLAFLPRLHETEYPVDDTMKEILTRSSEVLGQEFGIAKVREVLPNLTYNPGIIMGGEKSNVVAQHCELEVELRIPWGCSIQEVLDRMSAHAKNATITVSESHVPSITDPASPLVARTCHEIEKVCGGPVFPIVQWAASDARHLRRYGFSVLEYGPGEIASLHAVNERVPVASLEKAVDVYTGLLREYSSHM